MKKMKIIYVSTSCLLQNLNKQMFNLMEIGMKFEDDFAKKLPENLLVNPYDYEDIKFDINTATNEVFKMFLEKIYKKLTQHYSDVRHICIHHELYKKIIMETQNMNELYSMFYFNIHERMNDMVEIAMVDVPLHFHVGNALLIIDRQLTINDMLTFLKKENLCNDPVSITCNNVIHISIGDHCVRKNLQNICNTRCVFNRDKPNLRIYCKHRYSDVSQLKLNDIFRDCKNVICLNIHEDVSPKCANCKNKYDNLKLLEYCCGKKICEKCFNAENKCPFCLMQICHKCYNKTPPLHTLMCCNKQTMCDECFYNPSVEFCPFCKTKMLHYQPI